MAFAADVHVNFRHGCAGCKRITAGARYLAVVEILRMYICLHMVLFYHLETIHSTFIFARRTPMAISHRMNVRERIHTSEYLGVSARSYKLKDNTEGS